ncbi:MAG: hypothetical protein AB7E79_06515 [Rhodospirillaceae bacterium]
MTDDNKTDDDSPDKNKMKADASTVTPRAQAKFNPAFDAWLETKLHKIFDSVASEPLPADLMKLLGDIDQAEKKKK